VPESFRVLVKELQSLGLAVEVINEKDEIIQFGKDDQDDAIAQARLQPQRSRRERIIVNDGCQCAG
jgi:DNA-directed RNA polymerase subunit beta